MFRAGPEKRHLAKSPELSSIARVKKKTIVLYFMGIFTNFHPYSCKKSADFVKKVKLSHFEIDVYCSQKNMFGKMVTLPLRSYFDE